MHHRNAKGKGTTTQTKHSRRYKVLAERTEEVAPVGVWVEGVQDYQREDEHPAVRALLTEELQGEIQREKEDSLRRFQDNVRHRVAQQAQVLKRRQLQTSCAMADWEGRVLQQSSEAAQKLIPRKNLFRSSLQGELAICSTNSPWIPAQELQSSDEENLEQHQLNKVMRQVRLRLAACQTVRDGEVTSDLPGGIWKGSSTTDKPVSQGEIVEEEDGAADEDVPLVGQHDIPLHHSDRHGNKTVTFDNNPVCEKLFNGPYPADPGLGFSTVYRATQVLWPEEDQEELKRQRQSQFVTYRRLFMDVEREQVKEQQRHRKHLRRITRIKTEKEQKRLEDERKMEAQRQLEDEKQEMAEREFLILERLRLEEEERADVLEQKERARKDKESTRYIEALRSQMKEKMALQKSELPPLCCCGDSFWDSHPDTCANNCVFYKNPKAYVQALQSSLLSWDMKGGRQTTHQRSSARRIASMQAFSPRK